MKLNDHILIIDEESPLQRVNRIGEKHSKRHTPSRTHFVGILDEVVSVASKKVTLKNDTEAEFTDLGEETKKSRDKRVAKQEPARKAFIVSPTFFPLPKGMQAKINWVSIDEDTLTAIKAHDKGVREKREPVER